MAENGLRPIAEIMPADGVDPELAHDSLIQDLVPDVHYKRFYKRYGTTAYFKSHALPTPEYRRVVYLLRDGRDAMVSYHHFLYALTGSIDFLRFVQGDGVKPCDWHEHVERWSANPHQADMIVIRYEDLQAATVREMRRFCRFAGLDRDDTHLERIANQAAFTKAQAKERRQGWDNPAWPRDQPFIRRGKVGSYRDEMPPAVLAAFVKKAGATLKRFEYA
jgi:Sulfotransferase domain